MIIRFGVDAAIGAAGGLVIGSFIPSVLRRVKSGIDSVLRTLAAKILASAKAVETDAAAEIKKV